MPPSSRRSSTTTSRRGARTGGAGSAAAPSRGRSSRSSGRRARGRRAIGLLLVITALLAVITILIPAPPDRVADGVADGDGSPPDATPETALDLESSASWPDARSPAPTDDDEASDPPAAPLPPPPRARATAGVLAIVIDDVGNNLGEIEPFLALPGPLTFAVLPHLAQSAAAAALVRRAGHEVILHAPMEATDGRWPGPGTITVEHELLDVWGQLAESFESIDGATGANNHMGSRLTADPVAMDAVMAYLGATGKFFLDSRTTALTVAETFARAHNVPFLRRDVFLDNVRDPDAIATSFEEGVALATTGGRATLIGHAASAELAAYLARRIPALAADGMQLVGLADLALRDVALATRVRG